VTSWRPRAIGADLWLEATFRRTYPALEILCGQPPGGSALLGELLADEGVLWHGRYQSAISVGRQSRQKSLSAAGYD